MMHHLLHSLPSPPQLPPPPPSQPPILPFQLSRRSLSTAAASSLIFPTFFSPYQSLAATDCQPSTIPTTKTAFIDVSIDNEPAGRITIALYGNTVPTGAARFTSLVTGKAGISYRRKEFIKIVPNYIQHAGVRSYGVDAELAGKTGTGLGPAEALVAEWEATRERCMGVKNVEGAVGIVVRDPMKPPPKVKVVARKGRLEVEEEEVRPDPNGTEFVVVTRASPELDDSVLVVGRVVGGMEVVERISRVKTVQENTGSPYFR